MVNRRTDFVRGTTAYQRATVLSRLLCAVRVLCNHIDSSMSQALVVWESGGLFLVISLAQVYNFSIFANTLIQADVVLEKGAEIFNLATSDKL